MAYNWEHKNWHQFIYDVNAIQHNVLAFANEMGVANGLTSGVTEKSQMENVLQLMMTEAIKTSEIEGEFFSREDVMSSIKKNMGLQAIIAIKNKKAGSAGMLMVAVKNAYKEKLTEKIIKHWHEILFEFSTGINKGQWRKGKEPMQVISGKIGKETVHFQAPPSADVPAEMKTFVSWYNSFKTDNKIQEAVVKSAIAHLYFETIHPFEDGNGRIGRAIAEKALSQSLDEYVVISISQIIEAEKSKYYKALKQAQQTLDITEWLVYFSDVLVKAQQYAKTQINHLLQKTKFFDKYKTELNVRQMKVLKKMWEAGTEGFKGGMTAQKYMSITKTSKATATRDLQQLSQNNILQQNGQGRSVHYILNY